MVHVAMTKTNVNLFTSPPFRATRPHGARGSALPVVHRSAPSGPNVVGAGLRNQ